MDNRRKYKNFINHPATVPAIIGFISLFVYVLIIS